jgi:exosome complex exonuclease RRP6
VDNDSDFEKMLRTLSGATELAVDLEHHSYYTFLGLTCVMQVTELNLYFIFMMLELIEE